MKHGVNDTALPTVNTTGDVYFVSFFFSSRRRHTRLQGDWSSDVCSSDLVKGLTRVMQTVARPSGSSGDAAVAPSPAPAREVPGLGSIWELGEMAHTMDLQIGRASCRERV